MDFVIVTNNPRVQREYGAKYCIMYQECSFDEVLFQVRDMVHKGYKLLTHPLSGSVKPNETPYKSIMLTATSRGKIDNDSLVMIEDAIVVATSGKFDRYRERQKILAQRHLDDFQMVDFFLITGGIESAQTGLMV